MFLENLVKYDQVTDSNPLDVPATRISGGNVVGPKRGPELRSDGENDITES